MEADEVRKRPSAHEVGMPIETMSAEELGQRIEMLEGEIGRLKAAMESRRKSRSAADAFFKL